MNIERAWQALNKVADPEIPVISVTDLGIVREITIDGSRVNVALTPTYSGCPATHVIEKDIVDALLGAGAKTVNVEMRLSPPWTTEWLTDEARVKLKQYGISTSPKCMNQTKSVAQRNAVMQYMATPPANISCPRCDSFNVERIGEFGSTACKALYRCKACKEPFDYFKSI